jgi:hypothetical protein
MSPTQQNKPKWEVYFLVDPLDSQVRYVGMSKNAKKRFKQHLRLLDQNKRKNAWIDNLLGWGLLPELHIIEVLHDLTTAREREAYWISHYGWELLTNLPNITEQRKKVSA